MARSCLSTPFSGVDASPDPAAWILVSSHARLLTRLCTLAPTDRPLTRTGRDVSIAKVDAQGLDVALLQAAARDGTISQIKAVQMEVVRDRPPLKCHVQYGGEQGALAKCNAAVSAMRAMGFEPYGTNCSIHDFHEALGCEAEASDDTRASRLSSHPPTLPPSHRRALDFRPHTVP